MFSKKLGLIHQGLASSSSDSLIETAGLVKAVPLEEIHTSIRCMQKDFVKREHFLLHTLISNEQA
jgi:hypothetical protein